jgi:hypothetical protein
MGHLELLLTEVQEGKDNLNSGSYGVLFKIKAFFHYSSVISLPSRAMSLSDFSSRCHESCLLVLANTSVSNELKEV